MSVLMQDDSMKIRCVYIGHAVRRLTKHEESFQ
jgi:hypothetical protein